MARSRLKGPRIPSIGALCILPVLLFLILLTKERRLWKETRGRSEPRYLLLSPFDNAGLSGKEPQWPELKLSFAEWSSNVFKVPWEDLADVGEMQLSSEVNYADVVYPVAVKIFKRKRIVVEDVLREMEMSASVHHPGLVTFLGIVENTTHEQTDALEFPVGYVMEYFPGEQLEQLLDELSPKRREPIAFCMRIKIALDVSSALAYLHSHGIVHFDVKPEQILIHFSRKGTRGRGPERMLADALSSQDAFVCNDCEVSARLIDFGTALRFSAEDLFIDAQLENNTRWRGTLHYLAPEMIINHRNVTEKVDVYSFGVILWEMFTRDYPYRLTALNNVTKAIRNGNPIGLRIPNSCEPEWRELIMDCMQWRPEWRPSFQEITRRLQRLQRHGATVKSIASGKEIRSGSGDHIAGLIQSEGRRKISREEDSENVTSPDLPRNEISGPRLEISKAYDEMHDQEALEALRRDFPVFHLPDLLKGDPANPVGKGMYGTVFVKNITLTAKVFKKRPMESQSMRTMCLHALLRHKALPKFFGLLTASIGGNQTIPCGVLLEHENDPMKPLSVFLKRNHPLPLSVVKEFSLQLVDLLLYLNAHGIHWLNLTPEHILVRHGESPQLVMQDLSHMECQLTDREMPDCDDGMPQNNLSNPCCRHLSSTQASGGLATDLEIRRRTDRNRDLLDLRPMCEIIVLMCSYKRHEWPKDEKWGLDWDIGQTFDTPRCGFALRGQMINCMVHETTISTLNEIHRLLSQLDPGSRHLEI